MKDKEKQPKSHEPPPIDLFADDNEQDFWDKPAEAELYRDVDAPNQAYRQRGNSPGEEDFRDAFGEEDFEEYQDKPPAKEDADGLPFSFDRFGRTVKAPGQKKRRPKKKEKYGRRTDAQHATSLMVRHETEQQRELREAEERADLRRRQRERADVRVREQQRRERAHARRKRMAGLGLLLGTILVFVLIGYFTFLLNNVEIVGEIGSYSKPDLIRLSGLEIGKHMLVVDLSEAKENLEKDSYLIAAVEYVFPNQVQIVLRVRREAAAVRWGPNYEYLALIDNEGMVLRSNAPSSGNLPVISGLRVSGAEEKRRIGGEEGDQVWAALSLVAKLDEYGLLSGISLVDVTESMKISLTTHEGYRVEVGDAQNLDLKCTRFKHQYAAIMETAARFKREGHEFVTIYLYSKNGVVVSPYSPDYIMPDELTQPNATPDPDLPDPDATQDPNATQNPDATPNPDATDVPPDYQAETPKPNIVLPDDPFTG